MLNASGAMLDAGFNLFQVTGAALGKPLRARRISADRGWPRPLRK